MQSGTKCQQAQHILTLRIDILLLRLFMQDQLDNGAEYIFNANSVLPVVFVAHHACVCLLKTLEICMSV